MLPASASRRDLAVQLYERDPPRGPPPAAVVAIPARDEEERIGPCLEALVRQHRAAPCAFGIVLLANNCRDATVSRARHALGAAGLPNLVLALDLPAGQANAGFARGLALDVAATWAARAGGPGILLTTDADTRVGPDWLGRNLSALSGTCAAVAGRFVFDADEEKDWPRHLQWRRLVESAYEDTLACLSARLDPVPHDPWPNHWTESGASFALTRAAYERIGGLPAVKVGEDRALAAALARHDIAIRHDPQIVVTTSARLAGRARGGCASTLRRRCTRTQAPGDEFLEALPDALRRMVLRGRLRRAFSTSFHPHAWEHRLALEPGTLAGAARRRFGEAWARACAASPLLIPRPLAPAQMVHHLLAARHLKQVLERASAAGEKIEPVIGGALLGAEANASRQGVDEAFGGTVA